MEQNAFFRWVWRINGLILLGIVVIGVSVLVFEMLRDRNRDQTQETITNLADDPTGEEMWVLGQPIGQNPSGYLAFPLISELAKIDSGGSTYVARKSVYSSSSVSEKYPAKNVLFLKSDLSDTKWLFNNVNRLIVDIEEFPNYRSYAKNDVIPQLIIYSVIDSDTNRNGVLEISDKKSLAVSNLVGSEYKVLLKEHDRVISKRIVESSQLLLIYQIQGIGYAAVYKLDGFELVSEKELPKIGSS